MHPDDWRFIRMHPDVIGTRTADPVTSGLSAKLASASHTFPIVGTLANDFAFLLMYHLSRLLTDKRDTPLRVVILEARDFCK